MIETGQAFYGQHIGILVFSTKTPRIPGMQETGNHFPTRCGMRLWRAVLPI